MPISLTMFEVSRDLSDEVGCPSGTGDLYLNLRTYPTEQTIKTGMKGLAIRVN